MSLCMGNSMKAVLDFWYSKEVSEKWFNSTPEFDQEIKDRFEQQWYCAKNNKLPHWEASAEGCLALCIVLDQFPLNMFRGEAKSFETEAFAIAVSKLAIKKEFDLLIDTQRVSFLYMPLMHSEDLLDQALSVSCFEKRGMYDDLKFAKHHEALIQEFGRFPHRNEILGRENTMEEIEYLNSKRVFKG